MFVNTLKPKPIGVLRRCLFAGDRMIASAEGTVANDRMTNMKDANEWIKIRRLLLPATRTDDVLSSTVDIV